MPRAERGACSLVFFFVFVGIVIIIVVIFFFEKIAILVEVILSVFFVLFLFDVVGNGIQRHGVSLRDFQFGLTFRATQDFSLFHFVFVHIDFSGAFRAAE